MARRSSGASVRCHSRQASAPSAPSTSEAEADAQVRAVAARQAPRAAVDDHAALEHEPAAHLLVGQVGRVREVLHRAPDQLVGAEAQQRAQRAVHAHDAALGRDQRHGRRRHVEGAVEAGEGGLAAGVDAAAGDERVEADLQLVGAERLDDAVVRARQQQAGHVVGRGRERQQRHLAEAPAQRGDRARAPRRRRARRRRGGRSAIRRAASSASTAWTTS